MVDLDFAQATFEYILRKKIADGKLPIDGTNINCDDRYYKVDWKGLTIQQLWNELVDEEFASTIPEDDHDKFFEDVINVFIDNLTITDPAIPQSEFTLSDLPYWVLVKTIPKKYYRG